MMLRAKINKTVLKHRMLEPGDRVLVAVSGGPDSVCLLGVLKELSTEWNLTLHIAHLDHMFRGEESAAEALFVRDLADKLGTPVVIESFDVPALCRERGLSPQAGAREARYGFLNRVADDIEAHRIALGHTASDQAETLLMRLIRGAGASGLSGMPPKRGRFIRPLIDVTRDEVVEYVREQGLSFMTDSSNLKPVYTRNRVRLELMPALRAFNPQVEETLAEEAGILRDEDEVMEARLAEILPAIVTREGDAVRIQRDRFNAQPSAIRRRLFRAAVTLRCEDDDPGLSAVQTEEALGFIGDAQTGRAMDLPGGLSLAREYDTFMLRPGSPSKEFLVTLAVPGVTFVPGLSLEVEARLLDRTDTGQETADDVEGNYLWQAAFDYDKIAPPLVIRNRRDGDRFRPAGMGGRSKKVQDYFTDEKVPQRKRDVVPILATEQDIVWVVGMRTDERFLAGAGTKRMLVVTVKRER